MDVIQKLGGKPDEIKKSRSGFRVKRGDRSLNVNGNVGTLSQNNNVYNNTFQMYGGAD